MWTDWSEAQTQWSSNILPRSDSVTKVSNIVTSEVVLQCRLIQVNMNLQILLMLRKGDILHVNVCIFLCVFINVCEHESVNKCQQCFLWFTISQVGRLLCQGFHDPMLCTARGPRHSDFYKLLLDARFLITNDTLESKLRYFWVGKHKSEMFYIYTRWSWNLWKFSTLR